MTSRVQLRAVLEEDLAVFFEHQLDPLARHMAAFGAEDPADREAYMERWRKILADDSIEKRTLLVGGEVVGHLLGFEREGQPEVGYWLGREHWGRGLATEALRDFLRTHAPRPLHARVAADNRASQRVLEKCGFRPLARLRAFANARGGEIEEILLVLEGPARALEED
jgi:RimJ/RimL family protein N-acetyltransferase